MSAPILVALILWLLLTIGSVITWVPPSPARTRPLFARTPVLIITVAVLVLGLGAVAVLGRVGDGTTGAWSWVVLALAMISAVITGGAVTTSILSLADTASRPTPQRIQRNILRGGTWIGALERIGIAAFLLAGWPEGIAIILAVKGLARYPELRTSHSTGAAERFIIGTFASIGWAAACAGVALLLLRG